MNRLRTNKTGRKHIFVQEKKIGSAVLLHVWLHIGKSTLHFHDTSGSQAHMQNINADIGAEKQHFVEHYFFWKTEGTVFSCVSLLVMFFAGLPHHSFESENDSSHKTILDMAGHHENQYNTTYQVSFTIQHIILPLSVFRKTDGVLMSVAQSLSALHLLQHPA